MLGKAMVLSGVADPTTVDLLVRTVVDENIPTEYRRAGLAALWRATFNDLIDAEVAEEITDAPLGGLTAFSDGNHATQLRAYIVAIRAWFEGTDELSGQLYLLSRDDDPVVRAIAVESASHLAQRYDDLTLAMVPVNALFDPSREVMRVGVRSIPALPTTVIDDQSDAIVERFAVVMRSRDRRTRSEVVIAARSLVDRAVLQFVRFVELGSEDASWIVRRDSMGESETAGSDA